MVDYDFRNDSGDDVTTEVAFPIPAYTLDQEGWTAKLQGFDDFRLWVAGRPVNYAIETRAFVGSKDVTNLLSALHVDAASFGHYEYESQSTDMTSHFRDVARLSQAGRTRLLQANVITNDGYLEPLWRVEKKYHWRQTFPAHSVLHIRHQYTPVLGNSNTIGDMKHYTPQREEYGELASLCPTPALLGTLKKSEKKSVETDSWFGLAYVDFILTTANTWKTPIEDFTLIIERPHSARYDTQFVSFCWDGPITKIDGDHYSAHVEHLKPNKELRVGYIMGNSK